MTKALQPDDLIAHYRVIRALGAGGMGEVYLARDSTLDRDIALKVLPQMAQDDDRVRRFVLEAKSASSLSHPHIITVYEIGCEPVISASGPGAEKVHYIAMELVDGAALADIIHDDRHRTDLKTLLGYLAQASDGLAKAHASGIVHRDLKPGNIMVSKDGYAKVLDFGLAKLVEKTAAPDATINVATKQALTMEGMIVGTIGYMAPEQILGRPVDHRSDIFSFGCILFEAVTRRRPFTADSQFLALQKIIHEHPAPIESFVPDAPIELRQLVGRCLAKAPDDRIQGMKEVASDLRRIAGSYEVLARAAAAAGDRTVFYPTISGSIPPPPGSSANAYAAYPSTAVQQPGAYPAGVVPSGVASATVVIPAKKGLPMAAIAGIAVVVLALAGFLVYRFGMGGKSGGGLSEQAFGEMKIAPVLSNELLQGIAVSPDGRYAAYASLANTKFQLQVRQISTGTDIKIIQPQQAPITELSFSPDGDHLWYVGPDTESGLYSSLFEVASLGGQPKRVVSDADTAPTFSPDGKSIAFMRGVPQEKKTSLVIRGLEGGADRVLVSVTGETDIAIDKPRWSPDGKKIAVVSVVDPRHPNVVVYDVATGAGETLGNWKGPSIDSVAWMGVDGLVVAGAPAPGPIQPLWYLSYPGGARRRLSTDTSLYHFVSTSSDGKTIAARRSQRTAEIWQVPADGTPDDMKQVTSSKELISSVAAASDGTLVFIAPQEESITIWSVKPGGGNRTSIAPKGLSVLEHKFIRAQEATAFTAFGPDLVGHIHRASADGSNPKQLTNGAGESLVAVTPDGKYLLYNTPQARRTLMIMASDGSGPARQIATDYIDRLIFSKDSRFMSYSRLDSSKAQVVSVRTVVSIEDGKAIVPSLPDRRDYQFTTDGNLTFVQTPAPAKEGSPAGSFSLMRVPLAGGTPEKLFELADVRIDTHRWVDAKTVIIGARSTVKPVSNLWRWTVGTSKPVPLTNFPTGNLFELAPTQDGKTIYFTQGSNNRDIIKITGLIK